MERSPRSILVTGVAGFIGMPVASRLAALEARVVGLDIARPDVDDGRWESVVGDIRDPKLVRDLVARQSVDTIVHAGAISGPMLARNDPMLVCSVNVVGTINLLEAARAARVERFVYCSSAMAFGDTPPAPVPDDAPLRPRDLYGASKGASDLLLTAFRHQYGLDAVSLRISNTYGPRRRTRCAIRTMIENAIADAPTEMDWGTGYGRAYVYVDDVVDAVVAAVLVPRFPQPAYNIAGEPFMTMDEIAQVVREHLPNARIRMKPGMDELGYRRDALDTSAAKRDLGWRPRVPLERGIGLYAQWMRAQSGCAGERA